MLTSPRMVPLAAANDPIFPREQPQPRIEKRGTRTWFAMHPLGCAAGASREDALAAWRRLVA